MDELKRKADALDAHVQQLVGQVQALARRTAGPSNKLLGALIGMGLVLLVAVSAIGFLGWRNARQQNDRLRDVIHAQQVTAVVEQATRCVTSWTTREDIRDAIEKGARAPTSAITRLVVELGRDTSSLDRLGELNEEEIAAARGEIKDPTCSREDAQRILDDPAAAEAAVDR